MNKIINLTQENQETFLKQPYVVLFFYSKFCGPCKSVQSLLETTVENPKYKDISFVFVNVDEQIEMIKRFKISILPTIIGLHNNKVNFQHSGDIKKESLEFDLTSLSV